MIHFYTSTTSAGNSYIRNLFRSPSPTPGPALTMAELGEGQTPHTTRTRPEALLFINTVHPEEATNRHNLSQIRSHAAKEIRSRARKARKARLMSSVSLCQMSSDKHDHSASVFTSWPRANQHLVPSRSPVKSFTKRELFLFDHCKLIHPRRKPLSPRRYSWH
jgi:hypothetical protein